MIIYGSLFLFIISPFVAMFSLLSSLLIFYTMVAFKLLRNRELTIKYQNLFAPKLDANAVTILGYRVEVEELNEHLSKSILENPKNLMEKAEKMKNRVDKWIGIDINTLKTHFIVVGKTGGGKTEFIRSLSNDMWKIGGGEIMNDGKSDEKMLLEVGTQLKVLGRETSLRVINFLKPDRMSETNTLNPITMMSPQRAVEFLMNLNKTSENADATHQYFQQRGKAVLAPPITALSLRKELFKENFDFERIRNSISISKLVITYCLFYGISKDVNEMIKNNEVLSRMIAGYNITGIDENFKETAVLIEYVIQHPLEKAKVDREFGKLTFVQIMQIYTYVKEGIYLYLKEVWAGYDTFLNLIAGFLYGYIKTEEENFISFEGNKIIGISYDSFMKTYYNVKNIFIKAKSDEDLLRDIKFQEIKMSAFDIVNLENLTINQIKTGWTRGKAQGGNIEDIPEDAMQQHQYAVQQWTNLFNVFTTFRHIFGQSKSEINPRELLLDNQILYNLIPVKELGDDMTQIVGKISMALIDEVASIALGGEKISVHLTLKRIMKDKNLPKPIYLTFLDEYNSYPISGVDKSLLQYRSLNISVLIGIQNLAGLKVGGTSETSKENALGNATKVFLKTEDESAIKWLSSMISEEEIIESGFTRNWNGNLLKNDNDLKITNKKFFQPQIIQDFANGFGLVFKGSKAEDIVFFQSFYRGGKESTLKLTHFVDLENA
jgi:energy-coupling factor transporter ATP-binding protein EcfA2